jgi:hypothetical protein
LGEEHTKTIRSVSFDTSFLLRDGPEADKVVKELKKGGIPCYVTSTVISELNQLKVWGRIDERTYNRAMSRWRRVGGKVIDFKNRLLSNEFQEECVESMETQMGVLPKEVLNDCSIMVIGLKHGVDLFLSEDFHFTAHATEDVLREVSNNACLEYHQMCGDEMYSVNAKTFLKAYGNGTLDLDIMHAEHRKKRPREHGGKAH